MPLLGDNSLARLQGLIKVLQERLAAMDAAEEHHRVELDAARAEAADANASATIVTAATQRQPWTRRARACLNIRRLWPEPDHARRTTHFAQRTHAPASGSGSGSSTLVGPQR